MANAEGRIHVFHDDDGKRSRAAVFFRIILLIPHLIWFSLWSIAAVFILPIHWIVALAQGRSMEWAYGFYSSLARYALHLYSYWYLAADKYPNFLGDPGYVVDAEIPPPEKQRRWTIALRLFLALPPLILAATLLGGFGGGGGGTSGSDEWEAYASNYGLGFILAILAWFASLALARTPQGLRDAMVYCVGYSTQAYGYFLLLTERYPTSDPHAIPLASMPDHPVRIQLEEDDLRRNRLLVFFRILLAVPHLVWLSLWGIVAFLVAVVAWVAALITGRIPGALHRFLAAYVRYVTHVTAFLYLVGGPFPGFVGREGSYPVDLAVAEPAGQNRWKTLFRLFLALPAILASGGFSTVAFVAGVGAWFAALFTGRVPEGLRRLLGWTVRYQAQLNAYLALLTDRYPYTGPDGSGHSPRAAGRHDDPARPETWGLAPVTP